MPLLLNGEALTSGLDVEIEGVAYSYETLMIMGVDDRAKLGVTWVDPEPAPEPDPEPIRVSRIDFRRLLTPLEAARFRLLEAEPPVAAEELAAAFDPENPDVGLQIRVAVEDAIQQWNLLDAGVIELDHPSTMEFLTVMGLAGMFGSDAETRIPAILAQEPPGL